MSGDFWIPYGFNASTGKFLSYDDNRHLLTFGPTRSGKGATVIIPALLQVLHSVICIDPKGQNAAVTARRRRELGQAVHFINPFHELGLGTSRINPLAHLKITDRNVVADVASLSEAIIIDDGKDSHWSNSARGLVKALILHLLDTKGAAASLPEMRRLLSLPTSVRDGDMRETFSQVVAEMLDSEWAFIRQPAGRFMNVDSKEIASILSTAITQTEFLDDPNIKDALSGSDFSMMQLKEKPTTVFLILPGRYMEAYARFFRLLVTSAIDQLTSRVGGHPTLFVLDEFATLQNLAAISKAFGFAAGYKVQLWPFLQDLPQLQAIYPKAWESFLANAGLVQFFTPSDMTTAEFLERRGGKAEVEKLSLSESEISEDQASQGFTGVTKNRGLVEVPILPPEFTMSMDAESQVTFFSGAHDHQKAGRLFYGDIPQLRGMYDPDPFHG